MRQRDIQGRIDFLMDNFKKLDILKKYSFEELKSSFERVDSIIHRLQSSIEALLDIGRYIIAELGLRIPNTNAEVIQILNGEGFVSKDKMKDYIEMIGFRNRIVHEYNSVDLKMLYEIIQNESDELKELLALLIRVIKKNEEGKTCHKGLRFL